MRKFLLVSILAELLYAAIAINASICGSNNIDSDLACHAGKVNVTSYKVEIKEDTVVLDVCMKISTELGDLGSSPIKPANSCQEVFTSNTNSKSGLYWIKTGSSASLLYCDMNVAECGGGVWTRIANVDMTIPDSECPKGLELKTNPKRVCGKTVDTGSSTTSFSAFGLSYDRVCGYCLGYQLGTTDAFEPSISRNTVDSCYADGVLLSYGHPMNHLWTFTAMRDKHQVNYPIGCPCNTSSIRTYYSIAPGFVGNDFFCETASFESYSLDFFEENPLWDGKGYGTLPDDCQGIIHPWFNRGLPHTVNSDVDLRICLDEPRLNEDVFIEQFYLYIQ